MPLPDYVLESMQQQGIAMPEPAVAEQVMQPLPDYVLAAASSPELQTINPPEQLAPSAAMVDEFPADYLQTPPDPGPLMQGLRQTAKYITEPLPERGMNELAYWTENVPQSFGRAIPAMAVGMGSMAYGAAKEFTDPVYNALTGRQDLGEAAKELFYAPRAAGSALVEGIARFKGEPLGLYGKEAAKKAWADPAMAILGIFPEVRGAVRGAKALKPKASRSGLERDLQKVVQKGFDKGIKKAGFLKTRKLIEGELQKEVTAVKSFVKNKGSLEMQDAMGETIKGKLPKDLDQLSQANQQRMVDTFERYNDLQRAAGREGALIPPDTAVAALTEYINDKVIRSSAPEASLAYAEGEIARLSEAGPLTPGQAQKAMAIRNQSVDAYMKNPTPENASRAGVDAMIANNLRERLNSVVEAQGGEGYAQLKKVYGAHKSIDAAINKALQKDNRYVGMSSLNFYNVLGAKEMARGVMRAEPSSFMTGVMLEGVHAAIKMAKDPNRAARRMLEKSEKIIKKLEALPREEAAKIVGEIAPIGNNLPATIDPYRRMLSMAQTPEGLAALKTRLGREKKYTQLLDTLVESQSQLALPMPEGVGQGFSMKTPFGPQPQGPLNQLGPVRPQTRGQAVRAENQLINNLR